MAGSLTKLFIRRKLRDKFFRPFAEFVRTEASSGVLLLLATLSAIIWANSPGSASYHSLWHTTLGIKVGGFEIQESLLHWINDGLMAIFFFLVGLEIKREFLIGELASKRKAMLPILAALGGMVVPALIYAGLNAGSSTSRGWGIPMATDIAFALGVLSLLGSRVPLALKVFLAAVAIVDDIGAVLVIAVFYSKEINLASLGAAVVILSILAVFNRIGIRNLLFYILPGIVVWFLFLKSGVHATVAGVLVAMLIPTRVHLIPKDFAAEAREALEHFERSSASEREVMNEDQVAAVHELEEACERVQMPLQRLEHTLHPFVTYFVMPTFALANAGVALGADSLKSMGESLGLGVLFGLVLGKPIGIVLASWLAVKSGLAVLPSRVGWRQMAGVGILAGVGFTMSLFISQLAFSDAANVGSAKMAIMVASLISGVVGYAILRRNARPRRPLA